VISTLFLFNLVLETVHFNELFEQLGMDRSVLTKRLEWWKEKGILDESQSEQDAWQILANSSKMEKAVILTCQNLDCFYFSGLKMLLNNR
jgi:hypothetical protein